MLQQRSCKILCSTLPGRADLLKLIVMCTGVLQLPGGPQELVGPTLPSRSVICWRVNMSSGRCGQPNVSSSPIVPPCTAQGDDCSDNKCNSCTDMQHEHGAQSAM